MKQHLLAQIDFETLEQNLKPMPGAKIDLSNPNLTIGDIISAILPYIFIFAGLILFFLLISSGFQLLTAGGNPENQKKAQAKITSAFIGFVIIFLSYWITQIIGAILGIQIF